MAENPQKTFFRCTVCNDVHFGVAGPEVCPTCKQVNVYVAITQDEARRMTGL
ncbi:MAG: rubredoxin-like domain-containing protein [Candidatus Micrarchaeia archaeon]